MTTGDRYNVPPSPGADLEQRLRTIEQTLDGLFNRTLRHSVLPQGSIKILNAAGGVGAILDGDGFRLYDAAGNLVLNLSATGLRMYDAAAVLRARIGYINATAGYGVSVFDENAGQRFEVNDDGYRDPWLSHPWRGVPLPDSQSTTSGTFESLWRSRVELLTHKGVVVSAAWVTDAGTTGEVRLVASTGQTSAVALAAASSGVQQFRWLHGLTLGGGPVDFDLQARRTGGAGAVRLDQPLGGCEMADPASCTATGL